MNNLSLFDLKDKNDLFYNRALKNGKSSSAQEIKEIKCFLKDIEQISKTVDSLDDYQWLNDISVRWHSVFLTIFEKPIQINLSKPREFITPTSPIIFEDTITSKIEEKAYPIARARKLEEIEAWKRQELDHLQLREEDRRAGEVYLISDIFEGKPNFSFISPESYFHLEKIWLKELKCHRAYFIWLKDKKNNSNEEYNYRKACAAIRETLIDKNIKLSSSKFSEVKDYLRKYYLDGKNKLKHEGNKYDSNVEMLIKTKAKRIYESTKYDRENRTDKDDWLNAETYVKMFYEDIIPAVLEKMKRKPDVY